MNKILVVDDDWNVLEFLKTFFEKKGNIALIAKSGEEALVLVDQERPTMALVDVTMPGMSGLELLQKIRAKMPDLVVAKITGLHDEHLARKAASLGAYSYVTKPFDLHYLELVVLTGLMMCGEEEKSKEKRLSIETPERS